MEIHISKNLELVFYKTKTIITSWVCQFMPVANSPEKFESVNCMRIPKHLTVLLGHEQPSYKDLANILIWSMAAGVPFISFYDLKGTLKENEVILHHCAETRLPEKWHILWHSEGTRNGYSGKKIRSMILSYNDGKPALATAAKIISKLNKTEQSSIDYISTVLKTSYSFPDPDLGIYFGDYFNLMGYPPWQIRLTEFVQVDSHHNISLEKFKNVLQTYSKCEQKLGK